MFDTNPIKGKKNVDNTNWWHSFTCSAVSTSFNRKILKN